MEITVNTAKQLRLTESEFELIKQKLGRTPNFTELCAFSGMWSEHCSYKNSIKWLKTLPRDGGRMLVAAGKKSTGDGPEASRRDGSIHGTSRGPRGHSAGWGVARSPTLTPPQ